MKKAKARIGRSGQYVPRKKMFVQQKQVEQMLEWALEHAEFSRHAMLFLLTYIFLLFVHKSIPENCCTQWKGRGRTGYFSFSPLAHWKSVPNLCRTISLLIYFVHPLHAFFYKKVYINRPKIKKVLIYKIHILRKFTRKFIRKCCISNPSLFIEFVICIWNYNFLYGNKIKKMVGKFLFIKSPISYKLSYK